MHELLIETKID